MTRRQCLARIKELKKNVDTALDKEYKRLMNSGAVDLDGYEDTYALPSIILYAALRNVAEEHRPTAREHIIETTNLRNF